MASSACRIDPFNSADTSASAIIDPRNGKPTTVICGASVRAASCMVADALTKIVMIAGTDATALLELYNASALLISADDDVQISPDWQHAVHLAA
jgi:FAD:protein FMN transferase